MENVSIEMAGSELTYLFTDKTQLINLILTAYKQSLLHQVMKCVGSMDLLGNPVNLMKNIGTGFKDLFVKPANGFVRGPLQGFKGILDGGTSLTQKAVGGVFDTASKFTGGISKGLLTLTTDHKYIKKREDNKVSMKPGNVVTGVGYGMFSLFSGIYHGVTGVVTKPIEAAKEGNIGKGFLQGLTGLVVKPISGVFDLVSKTTEGVKNNISSKNTVERNRPLRAFYGKYLVFKDFNRFHSDIYLILNDISGNSYTDFCDAVIYYNKSNEYSLLIVNKTEIIFYDLGKNKMKAKLNFADITNVSIEGSCVKIYCLDKNRKINSWVMDLLDPTKSNLNTIHNLVNRHWRNYNTELL
jgi:vacuolar protein sorting-associated protein 13A/C